MAKIASNTPEGYNEFLRDLKERIEETQVRTAIALNTKLVLLYWQIGRDILTRQQQQGWSAKVINRLATDLCQAFPGLKYACVFHTYHSVRLKCHLGLPNHYVRLSRKAH